MITANYNPYSNPNVTDVIAGYNEEREDFLGGQYINQDENNDVDQDIFELIAN